MRCVGFVAVNFYFIWQKLAQVKDMLFSGPRVWLGAVWGRASAATDAGVGGEECGGAAGGGPCEPFGGRGPPDPH